MNTSNKCESCKFKENYERGKNVLEEDADKAHIEVEHQMQILQ